MSFFSHLFHPPAQLKLPVFALDISDRSFKYIQFEETANGRRTKLFGSGTIAEGIITSGDITDSKKLAQTLREQLVNGMPQFVALALPEEKGFVRTITMPKVTLDELHEAVVLQLEEYIPLPPDQVSFAYHMFPGTHAEVIDVLVAAYPTVLIQTYCSAVEQAGFLPVSLEIESQAIARAIIPTVEETEPVLVVDIGLTRTSFLFAQNGYTKLTSTIPIGGHTMHEAIMKTLHVSETEAEKAKIEFGLGRTTGGKKIYEALSPVVSAIQNEIERRTEFWNDEMRREAKIQKKQELKRIYLCGREANLIGIAPHLSSQLRTPVALANVWVNALSDQRFVPEIEFRDSLGYATSIGLALGIEES